MRHFSSIPIGLTAAPAPRSIEAMSTRIATIQRLPIRLVLGYVAATVFVFIYGPFDWPIDNWGTLLGFLADDARAVARLPLGGRQDRGGILLRRVAPRHRFRGGGERDHSVRGCPGLHRQDALGGSGGLERSGRRLSQPAGPARVHRRHARADCARPHPTWPLVFAVLPFGILHWAEMGVRCASSMLITSAPSSSPRSCAAPTARSRI